MTATASAEALVIAEELLGVWPQLAAEVYQALGRCYKNTGDCARALELHEKQRTISEELGHRAGVAKACSCLGVCY